MDLRQFEYSDDLSKSSPHLYMNKQTNYDIYLRIAYFLGESIMNPEYSGKHYIYTEHAQVIFFLLLLHNIYSMIMIYKLYITVSIINNLWSFKACRSVCLGCVQTLSHSIQRILIL